MRRRRLLTISVLGAAAALAVCAMPAQTADNGTVTVTVTAQSAAVPCLTISPDSVDFGTMPYSQLGGSDNGAAESLTATFCSTTPQRLYASATSATGPSGSWTLSDSPPTTNNPCDLSLADTFYLRLRSERQPAQFVTAYLNGSPTPLHGNGGGDVFLDGAQPVELALFMPCQGSNGAGEQKTLTATFTAVVP